MRHMSQKIISYQVNLKNTFFLSYSKFKQKNFFGQIFLYPGSAGLKEFLKEHAPIPLTSE